MNVKGKVSQGEEPTGDDFFHETPVLWERKYVVQVEEITPAMAFELNRTARYCNTDVTVECNDDDVCRVEMFISAAGAIRWAREALCPNKIPGWDGLMQEIFGVLCVVEPGISPYLMYDCVYRGGICFKETPCPMSRIAIKKFISMVPEKVYREARNEAVIDKVKVDAGLIN